MIPSRRAVILGRPHTVSAGVNNTALDTGAVNTNGVAPLTMPGLTTTAAGIVLVFVELNGGAALMTVSGSTLGSFTQRAISGGGAGNTISEWWALSSGALTSEVITITAPAGVGGFCEGTAFSVKGVNIGANNGFDTNGALPNIVASGSGTISTSSANDFLIAGFRGGANTPVSGWTQIVTGSFSSVSYLKVTSAQSSLNVPDPMSNNGGVCDALVSA